MHRERWAMGSLHLNAWQVACVPFWEKNMSQTCLDVEKQVLLRTLQCQNRNALLWDMTILLFSCLIHLFFLITSLFFFIVWHHEFWAAWWRSFSHCKKGWFPSREPFWVEFASSSFLPWLLGVLWMLQLPPAIQIYASCQPVALNCP